MSLSSFQVLGVITQDKPGSKYLYLNIEKISCQQNRDILHIWVFPRIVGKNPKWMVYDGKPYEQMDDLRVLLFLETPIL